jgi:hypothetical protein
MDARRREASKRASSGTIEAKQRSVPSSRVPAGLLIGAVNTSRRRTSGTTSGLRRVPSLSVGRPRVTLHHGGLCYVELLYKFAQPAQAQGLVPLG